MGPAAARLPAAFWTEPAVATALASCDFPVLLAEIQRVRGWTQSELAREIGYSQSWVSRVMRGKQELTLDQVREISVRLTIPVHLLRFGSGGDDPARRREFGQAVILAGLALPGTPQTGAETAPALTAITQAQRRLESTTPARELEHGVAAHAEMASRALARARTARQDVAAALSEAAGLAAWLHADMCDLGTARMYYRMAVDAARHAGHNLLAGYMLGSLAAFEIEAGDPIGGLGLTERARTQISKSEHPAPRAWLAAIQAVGHATAGSGHAAQDALRQAEDAAASSQAQLPPPWPWLFPFDHAKLAGYRALVYVRLRRPGDALAAFTESLAAAQPAPKQRAMIMLEVATARCQEGVADKDVTRVNEAFRLASEAVTAGAHFGSERVIQRSRQFRRSYTGPASTQVKDFDQQLRSMLW